SPNRRLIIWVGWCRAGARVGCPSTNSGRTVYSDHAELVEARQAPHHSLNQLQVFHYLLELLEILLRHRAERQAEFGRGSTHQRHSLLDRDGIGLQKQNLKQWIEFVMEIAGLYLA